MIKDKITALDFVEGLESLPPPVPAMFGKVSRLIDDDYSWVPFTQEGIRVIQFGDSPFLLILSDTGWFPPEINWIPYEQETYYDSPTSRLQSPDSSL